MKTLPINLDTFGFVEREKNNSGKYVLNRCGRDFLYYSLNYFHPDKYNSFAKNPQFIQKNNIFGLSTPPWLAFALLQFIYVPKELKKEKLELFINDKLINSVTNFYRVLWKPSRTDVGKRIKEVEFSIDKGFVVGIDLSLFLFGIFDHVMFVYGYDEDNFYVFDTRKINKLEYEKITEDNRYIMRLPKDIVRKRWSFFGRVWIVKRIV
ncbi:MAG: hypothetical protein WC694_03115 [Candidatus Paceibacterota bacterium]|jgi:hypothetical protein